MLSLVNATLHLSSGSQRMTRTRINACVSEIFVCNRKILVLFHFRIRLARLELYPNQLLFFEDSFFRYPRCGAAWTRNNRREVGVKFYEALGLGRTSTHALFLHRPLVVWSENNESVIFVPLFSMSFLPKRLIKPTVIWVLSALVHTMNVRVFFFLVRVEFCRVWNTRLS